MLALQRVSIFISKRMLAVPRTIGSFFIVPQLNNHSVELRALYEHFMSSTTYLEQSAKNVANSTISFNLTQSNCDETNIILMSVLVEKNMNND